MTSEESLRRCGFERCQYPYMVGAGVELYRMLKRDEDRTIMFEQTQRSFPNYRFAGAIEFVDGHLETLATDIPEPKEEATGDNFPVIP